MSDLMGVVGANVKDHIGEPSEGTDLTVYCAAVGQALDHRHEIVAKDGTVLRRWDVVLSQTVCEECLLLETLRRELMGFGVSCPLPADVLDLALQKLTAERCQSEQLQVQLGGCLTAAEGHRPDPPVAKGAYGWSLAYQTTLELHQQRDEAREVFGQCAMCSNHGRDGACVTLCQSCWNGLNE